MKLLCPRVLSGSRARSAPWIFSWLLLMAGLLSLSVPVHASGKPFSPRDLLSTRYVTGAVISPGGEWIAYTLRVPRKANEKPGGPYYELYLASVKTGEIRPFITGKVSIGSVQWKPDGSAVSFTARRDGSKGSQVWLIPVDGGEARQVTRSETSVLSYRWHPSGKKISYVSIPPKSKHQRALEKKGYGFIFYEEDIRPRNLYIVDVENGVQAGEPRALVEGMAVWSLEFSPNGKYIAAAVSPRNLIDHSYMFKKVYLVNVATGEKKQLTDNPGKLGNFAFSPDGRYLAYAAALTRDDNQVSQAFVIPAGGGEAKNLTIPDFKGHVNWVGWKDNATVVYRAGEGVQTTLSLVPRAGGKRKVILRSGDNGIIFDPPTFTTGLTQVAFTGQTPYSPRELFTWTPGGEPKRLTDSNPWLADRELGRQSVIRYKSRDGWDIEGLLIYPVGYREGESYPLIVIVHGGPESHYSNGWNTYYATPGQVLAGKGYVVFYPNYRSSTGYGVKYAAVGFGDPAGKEFDDIADGIDHLVKKGIADKRRIGLGGGSYGGYASAWFATYYTRYVRAVCMFVGISDLISKRGTTDIPYENLYVHAKKRLKDDWEFALERSPIYYAHQSKTATLIYGGAADTRVHPSQSMELYRRMKMNNHPAVRLVQYPGEGHGNRKQPGRIDVLYRQLDWYDWYVRDLKPLDGPMPPLDISDKYGIDLSD